MSCSFCGDANGTSRVCHCCGHGIRFNRRTEYAHEGIEIENPHELLPEAIEELEREAAREAALDRRALERAHGF